MATTKFPRKMRRTAIDPCLGFWLEDQSSETTDSIDTTSAPRSEEPLQVRDHLDQNTNHSSSSSPDLLPILARTRKIVTSDNEADEPFPQPVVTVESFLQEQSAVVTYSKRKRKQRPTVDLLDETDRGEMLPPPRPEDTLVPQQTKLPKKRKFVVDAASPADTDPTPSLLAEVLPLDLEPVYFGTPDRISRQRLRPRVPPASQDPRKQDKTKKSLTAFPTPCFAIPPAKMRAIQNSNNPRKTPLSFPKSSLASENRVVVPLSHPLAPAPVQHKNFSEIALTVATHLNLSQTVNGSSVSESHALDFVEQTVEPLRNRNNTNNAPSDDNSLVVPEKEPPTFNRIHYTAASGHTNTAKPVVPLKYSALQTHDINTPMSHPPDQVAQGSDPPPPQHADDSHDEITDDAGSRDLESTRTSDKNKPPHLHSMTDLFSNLLTTARSVAASQQGSFRPTPKYKETKLHQYFSSSAEQARGDHLEAEELDEESVAVHLGEVLVDGTPGSSLA